ncbi:MAG: 16S rRNA (cytosine(967)-C(5))-methyltransferase RsmB [Myxococcales bacterium]|nr:16S rRNA (cytosine(967)-C(5))-methyltransferase RsmB [Myxococcales bacterium]
MTQARRGGRGGVAKPGAPALPKAALPTARTIAIQVLARVAATDAYLNVVLDSVLDELPPKDPRDAALATELAYGATRRQLTLDFAISTHADRKLDAMEDRVLAALRIGAYQLFFTRIPKHAAVADTVEALRQVGLGRASGFVNAILRKLSPLESAPLPPSSDEAALLAVKESHPEWLVRRWLRQFGPERARAMLAADNEAPALAIRANTAKVTRDELLSQLTEVGVMARAASRSPVGLILESPGRVEDLYGYAEGLWQVQDEAAQLVGVFAQVPASARVLDACAAPGGKACHLAQSNEVLAIDLHGHKLRKIDAEARRLGVRARLRLEACDASKPLPDSFGEFDAVLIDAPCSGLGTLRRHPELRYRRQEKDLASLTHLQREILEHCQRVVKPGGLLVYAVCSTDPVEGADQIEMFLRSHPDFTSEPPVGLGHLPTWQGHLRTLPGPEGFDGFFAARLRKLY